MAVARRLGEVRRWRVRGEWKGWDLDQLVRPMFGARRWGCWSWAHRPRGGAPCQRLSDEVIYYDAVRGPSMSREAFTPSIGT